MKKFDIARFIANGKDSGVQIGCTIGRILSVFGLPQDLNTPTKKSKSPSILKYDTIFGNVQFMFDQESETLIIIGVYFDKANSSDVHDFITVYFDNAKVSSSMAKKDIMAFLLRENISYKIENDGAIIAASNIQAAFFLESVNSTDDISDTKIILSCLHS